MGLFTKLFGGTEGCREAMRDSYSQHVKAARTMGTDTPHVVGLFGALGSRYKARGLRVSEAQLWFDLSPFLAMKESIAVEAIAEYAVFQERPADARREWLKRTVNDAFRFAADPSILSIAAGGILNRSTWCELLDPDIFEAIQRAVSDDEVENLPTGFAPRKHPKSSNSITCPTCKTSVPRAVDQIEFRCAQCGTAFRY